MSSVVQGAYGTRAIDVTRLRRSRLALALAALSFGALPLAASLGRADALEPVTGHGSASYRLPRAQLGEALRGAGVLSGATTRRQIHFTFDDGPDPTHTPRVLEALDRAGFKATFFFSTSRFAAKNKRNARAAELAREVARRGHQLGSHGFEHQRMSRLAPPALRAQLDRSEAMFERVFGQRTYLFRPPFGSTNAAFDAMLGQAGYATATWNVGMADWVARKPELIRLTFWRVLERNETERGERGGIVLMHDTHAWSVDAFALIATSIRERNCELLVKGEELYDVTESLEPWAKPLSEDQYAARQRELAARAEPGCSRRAEARVK
jgi:peptidoglycan/xylan/chitin deacetylase (PgdA/CDA1 family)